MIGSLIHSDYVNLLKDKQIISSILDINQIQPSSIDLTLSKECYEIKYSFLSPQNRVRDKLDNLIIKEINLDSKHTFEKNKTYLVRLNEKLNLNCVSIAQVIPRPLMFRNNK